MAGGFRRRKFIGKRTFRKRRGRVPFSRNARQAGFRKNRRMVPHVEFKVIDSATNLQALPLTGTFFLLNSAANGTLINERTGQTMWNKSVQLDMSMFKNVAGGDTGVHWLVMLVWDKDPDNATPLAVSLQNVAGPLEHRQLNNRDRWLILKQWKGNVTGQKLSWQTRMYKKFSLRTVFSGSGTGVVNIRSGALWLYATSDGSTGANETQFSFNSRVRFTDA